jgi:hypothetical protein
MKVLRFLAVSIAALVGTSISGAQAPTEEGLLRGVARLDPFVLPLDKDSETCGINEGRVRQVLS